MKLCCLTILVFGLSTVSLSAQDAPALKTDKDKVSYGIGVEVARSFKSQGIDVDTDMVVKGLRDALAGQKLLMTDQELEATINGLQQQLRQKQIDARNAASDSNKKASDAFLAANSKKDGVVTLPDGLQYKIEKSGTGKKPVDDDTVVCNYRGTLIDGTEFDSSYKSGQPATFQVKAVIPGFREALELMPAGSTWQFFVPAELAYGERGAGDAIGPNAALVFEIELISVTTAADKP